MEVMRLLLFMVLPLAMWAETPVFRAGSAWVRVDVQVEEGHTVLSGLGRGDFVVSDEGAPQAVVQFGRESEPLRLLLLVDISGSMHAHLQQVSMAAREALDRLQPDDEVAVMVFRLHAAEREEFTRNRAVAARALNPKLYEELELGSGTAINQAILDAAEYLVKTRQAGRRGREAVLMLTDNRALNYQVPDARAIGALQAADAVFNAIVTGKHGRPKPVAAGVYTNPDFTPSDVFRIAEETGGEAVASDRAGRAFTDLLERIRTRYTLLYAAPKAEAGTFRRIRVELSPEARRAHPKARLRYRTGYLVTKGQE
jgi:VWFA-related protein